MFHVSLNIYDGNYYDEYEWNYSSRSNKICFIRRKYRDSDFMKMWSRHFIVELSLTNEQYNQLIEELDDISKNLHYDSYKLLECNCRTYVDFLIGYIEGKYNIQLSRCNDFGFKFGSSIQSPIYTLHGFFNLPFKVTYYCVKIFTSSQKNRINKEQVEEIILKEVGNVENFKN